VKALSLVPFQDAITLQALYFYRRTADLISCNSKQKTLQFYSNIFANNKKSLSMQR